MTTPWSSHKADLLGLCEPSAKIVASTQHLILNEVYYNYNSPLPKVWLSSARKELRFETLRFYFALKLCDAVQRVHGNAGDAGHGPLASAPRKCRNAVGGLRKTLEKGPKKRRIWCDTFPAPCSRSSTSKACSRRLLTMGCEGAL